MYISLLREDQPVINSFLAISTPIQCRSIASAHPCEVTDVGGANRDSAIGLRIYLSMSGLYLAQGTLVKSSRYFIDQLARTLVVPGKESLPACRRQLRSIIIAIALVL